MRKKAFVILVICLTSYIGLGLMNSPGGATANIGGDRTDPANYEIVKSLPPPDFHSTNLNLTRAPKLRCVSAMVVDNSKGEILYEKHADRKRSMASITKLLAAIVLAEMDFDLNKKVTMTRWDAKNSARSRLKIGEIFLAKDLFYAALICSDNRAIKALARTSGVTYPEFIKKMNAKAREIGMDSTRAVDPSGIYSANVSTPRDIVRLVNAAVKYPIIKSALTCQLYEFRSLNHKRFIRIGNTNRMLKSKYKVDGGKTGYISAAGYCLAVKMKDEQGSDITTVVLGSNSNNYRFSETRKIADWAFKNLRRNYAQGG